MEIVQVGQEPRTLNKLPLRGPPNLPSRRLVSQREDQRTRAIVQKVVVCMLGEKSADALNMSMQSAAQCKV